ncbi:hypothetical protein CANINC_005079 [Pichia inconspicua]|uniref:Phospholipase n=1 Tax=Pichia inconspicua TaxID=52247 RepID=A0A4T0WUD6_9ASCO|nr:hypothetical protein CANINC_005079 [[Candida] inconspicua]
MELGKTQNEQPSPNVTNSRSSSAAISAESANYYDANDSLEESDSSETRDYLMAKRIHDAEVINNRPNLNPLLTPFFYFDGTTSVSDGLKQAASGLLKSLTKSHTPEENGNTETSDKERMKSIKSKIHKLEASNSKHHAALNALHEQSESLKNIKHSFELGERIDVEQKSNEKENVLLKKVNHHSEPLTLPSRNSTWRHSNKHHFSDTNALRLVHSNLSSNFDIEEIEPQDALDSRNNIKTAKYVDTFLLGIPDILCLTSSFLKDENGLKKGPLIIPLLSLYITDITNDVYISSSSQAQKIEIFSDNMDLKDFNRDDLLKVATFAKNRIFKLHLEYGVGNYVLRWDIERDAKSLLNLHKKLLKRNTKERIERLKRKDTDLPKFPVLPTHFAKFRGLFKGDREILVNNYDEPNLPLERQNSQQGSVTESVQSVAHTLTKLSTNAFNSFKKKDKVSKIDKEKEKEKEKEKQLLILHERVHLNRKYKEDMQQYFDKLFENITMKDQSQKLLQFLELSPLSLLLTNEIYRKRKEGFMFIVSSAAKQGWRVGHFKFQDFGEMIKRHTSKWCILGDSCIIYTSDILSTTPEEVFLIDSKIELTIQGLKNSQFNINKDNEDMDRFNLGNENTMQNDNDDNDYDNDYPKSILRNAKSYPTIKLTNSERTIKLLAKNPKVTVHWAASLRKIINDTEWANPHRFDSFAPVRTDAYAQWFVDARDYWYAASSAIEMAKDVIYIHDWWLSPELYLRRPANGNQDWRIDRLLEKKAKQGVKIFVIIYRNVGNTVVTDSMYTKHSLLDLHENIYVLRSPNQIMQNVFFWAHHEKLLIIDHTVCFLGGIDLCFGRYDTPDHVLVDDSTYPFDSHVSKKNHDNSANSDVSMKPPNTSDSGVSSENINDFQSEFQVFSGKDYSNPRIKDFYELTVPHEDMYDRNVVPRMPWHDVHMVTSGQVARDLSRHFIQRWNYLLRQKRPSRPTPLLIPPRPFTDEELKRLDLKGTCEIQLLRSSCDWSLGLQQHEQSIQNAYIKCIEQSEHFIYIENQFFITSCTVDNTVVKNEIGDALVDRIITAHKNGEVWKAVIVIPLMPGFEANVDTKEGGSVRLIMQCQYMSISMGETSIFARLRRVGIRPEDYITFYSLRKWGLIGPNKTLTTEQLYIHAKTMIVDDRIAIIGSANINERSMRGTRDSEVCAIVRDKDMVESTMDGKPYLVGQFAHTLRMRLMREHLGVDVDLLDMVERRFLQIENFCKTPEGIKASILSSNQGDQKLSAMVELGTRYLLGLTKGTKYFNNVGLSKQEELTQKMMKTFTEIHIKSNDQKLDEHFSFSFNHRAGYENAGIRSAKNLSKDTRVKTEIHKNEVKGDYDGYNTKYFFEARMKVKKFLTEKVQQYKFDNVDCYPLPEFEDVEEILDQSSVNDLTPEEHDSLNKDRWILIKKLFYMAKLHTKMEKENGEKASSTSSPTDLTNAKAKKSVSIDNLRIDSKSRYNSPLSKVESAPPEIANTKSGRIGQPLIPLSKLSAEEIDDIDKNELPSPAFSFIDPYGFEDPLDIDFYEGTWMTYAIRNTVLFQMVFHVQPDDTVQTWRDYKDFEQLNKAFNHYQNEHGGNMSSGVSNDTGTQFGRDSWDSFQGGSALNDDDDDEEVEENRRRAERDSKLAELHRYLRNVGGLGMSIGAHGEYDQAAVYDYQSALKLMNLVQGHIVLFPTRWLQKEVEGSNWFYKADMIPPIQIYN